LVLRIIQDFAQSGEQDSNIKILKQIKTTRRTLLYYSASTLRNWESPVKYFVNLKKTLNIESAPFPLKRILANCTP